MKTRITMKVISPTVNTREIPATYPILNEFLPSIFLSKCFNSENLPFATEVRQTEVGHLFEHILLEYLCQLKILKGHNEAVYSGVTNWNWRKEPWGMFHININVGFEDADILPEAMDKTISLVSLILQSNAYTFQSQDNLFAPSPQPARKVV